MKKKSIQALIIVLIVGIMLPKIYKISSINLINKGIWKLLINFAFTLSTVVIGFSYKVGAVRNRKEVGIARIKLFLLIILFLCASVSTLVTLYSYFVKILMVILGIIIVAGLIYILYISIRKLSNFEKKNKHDFNYERFKKSKNIYLDYKYLNSVTNTNRNLTIANQKELIKPELKKNYDVLPAIEISKYNTIEELWKQKDPKAKCITISNCENENLKWVKIYKNRYGDGNFYGYVMMNNARETVNGIIYYSDRPIWYNV